MAKVPSTGRVALFLAGTGVAMLLVAWNSVIAFSLLAEQRPSPGEELEEKLRSSAAVLMDELRRTPPAFQPDDDASRRLELADRLWRICEVRAVVAPAISAASRLDARVSEAAVRADDALVRACRMKGLMTESPQRPERRAAELEIRTFASEAAGALETASARLRLAAPEAANAQRTRRLRESLFSIFMGLAGCLICLAAIRRPIRRDPAASLASEADVNELRDELTMAGCYCDLVLSNLAADDANRHDVEEIRRASIRAIRILARSSGAPENIEPSFEETAVTSERP
jgi:hypothetical protein